MLVPSHFFSALFNDTTQFITSFTPNFTEAGNRILPGELTNSISNTPDIRLSTIICGRTVFLE